MMFHSKKDTGFSLIELMVVMAIVAVLLSLTGGVIQKNIAQQEKQIELEKTKQLFKKLTYKAYYLGKTQRLRLEQNKILITEQINENINKNESELANFELENSNLVDDFLSEQSYGLPTESVITNELIFNQLTFVAQDYAISPKGIITPNTFGVISSAAIQTLALPSFFNQI